MQTDPNWSNFYFNETNNKVHTCTVVVISLLTMLSLSQIILLDFGASREYSNQFTNKYVKVTC